ncbi:MAG TPA: hypothetical protein VH583_14525 [Vicinamibacterales bacterium]|jgi:hypothetical protein
MSPAVASVITLSVSFLDGTEMAFRYPRQSGNSPASILATVQKAIDADKLLLEVAGDLVLIPIGSVKSIRVSPAPPHLPSGVLRNARAD